MCLPIDSENPRRGKPTEPRKVYKVYRKTLEGTLSPHRDHRVNLRKGRWVKSNRRDTILKSYEISQSQIIFGIHAYTSKERAQECAKRHKSLFVVKMEGLPEDFVAFSSPRSERREVVYTKLRYLGRV